MKFDFILHAIFYCICFILFPFKALPPKLFIFAARTNNTYIIRYRNYERICNLEAQAETAVLVGLVTKTQDERKTNEYLDELAFLAETAGAK